jgi:hypothetical protein
MNKKRPSHLNETASYLVRPASLKELATFQLFYSDGPPYFDFTSIDILLFIVLPIAVALSPTG